MKQLHFFLVFFPFVTGLFASPADDASGSLSIKIRREGDAKFFALAPASLFPGTPLKLYPGVLSGVSFDVFVSELPAQALTIELGFIDAESKGIQQNTFAVAINGAPLDANLDVFGKADGAFKPWVMKTAYVHSGGPLAIQFTGLGHPAFISYARISDAKGMELAFGNAADWKNGERIKLLDARSRPFHRVKVGEVPFFNSDHSPVGTWSSFIYGMEESGGVQVCKWGGGKMTLVPDQGVIIAVKNGTTERIMPFACKQTSPGTMPRIGCKEVTRKLGACTDEWTIPMGVSWTHYTPVWQMKDWEKASREEKRRFALPVTWMRYRIDNRTGKEETQLLFSLQQHKRSVSGHYARVRQVAYIGVHVIPAIPIREFILALIRTGSDGGLRFDPQHRLALLADLEAGGMSAMAFARLHGTKYPTFMSWVVKRRRREAPPAGHMPSTSSTKRSKPDRHWRRGRSTPSIDSATPKPACAKARPVWMNTPAKPTPLRC